MKLLHSYLKDCIKTSKKNNMQVRVIGDISRLEPDLQAKIKELEEVSASNTGLHFQVALNYGGRDELRRAVHNMVQDAENGSLHAEEVTEEKIAEYQRDSRSGSDDTDQRGAEIIQLSVVAACLCRVLFYGHPVAGFQ